MTQFTSAGTRQCELMGIAPTGGSPGWGSSSPGSRPGKIADNRVNWDVFGMFQQLGVAWWVHELCGRMDARPRLPRGGAPPPDPAELRPDRAHGRRARCACGPCSARKGCARTAVPAGPLPPSASRGAAPVPRKARYRSAGPLHRPGGPPSTRASQSSPTQLQQPTPILDALPGTGTPYVHTSGGWVLGNTGTEPAGEDAPIAVAEVIAWRAPLERTVRRDPVGSCCRIRG